MSTPLPHISLDVGPSRLESRVPREFRVGKYPDGSKRVQGGYSWSQGTGGGITWRDLPVVNVDELGEEIQHGS